MPSPTARLGPYALTAVSDGTFKLDGGAMFGIVPKPMWEKVCPPDEQNRIVLGLNCLLIQGHGHNVLVDAGVGTKWSAKEADRFAVDHRQAELVRSLAAAGLQRSDIDIVICTHLHFDHVGGCTVLDAQGDPVPTFPEAVHWVRRDEWEWANAPNDRVAGSYRPENFVPIQEAGLFRFSDADHEVIPGVFTQLVGGHTPFLDLVRLHGGGTTALFLADLIPMTAHLHYPWNMGYDLDPVTLVERKKEIEPKAAAEGWLMVFEHDPHLPFARLQPSGQGRYGAVPWAG